ncbi:peptidoglycan DD-metalloendopeptidase family protein [Chitiniphilus purpureus]|uniref:Peptidoglycan DD-metalloendopeptidase family protein n=1 Tax=Chitiniphilus purpureus TaxID=2981137 RepID=A0ABY6DRA4_9NEIS|nr:peptidoglycan DD-metalloendopeptidase family protein [Chitiniphilus sp. CD1]UXY14443.1 peptidoglycan DD-metalloendopeptidase family protein [Chitiniphilus sp. CD1]
MSNRLSLAYPLSAAFVLALVIAGCGSTPASPSGDGAYRVQRGDTLYRIARQHGRSTDELARWNGLADPGDIRVGQWLRLTPPGVAAHARGADRAHAASAGQPHAALPSPNRIALTWPVDGAVIARFNGNHSKGLDLAGARGSTVRAAAAGKVVYAGTGIRSYGRLLIVKHRDDYLTAYAHNETLLVAEGEAVRQGQPIATMGDSGTDGVKLHFELRRQGKAIDPLPFLPPR